MLKQRIEMRLPDDTMLIAEGNQQSEYPSINIYHKDTDGNVDEVAFAEYSSEKEIGRRLMVAAYQNDDDDTRYYKSYRHLFKPSFNELNQVYKKCEENDFRILCNNFAEIVNVSNDLVIYRDFNYDNDKLKEHVGHKIVLAGYGGESGIENISIECEDCCEVLYSADKMTLLPDVYQFRKPRNMLYINCFAQDGINLKDCGCIGRVTVIFGGGKDQCKMICDEVLNDNAHECQELIFCTLRTFAESKGCCPYCGAETKAEFKKRKECKRDDEAWKSCNSGGES